MNLAKNRLASMYARVDLDSKALADGPQEMVSLLYEGFLERLTLARAAMASGDMPNRVRHLGKAIQILSEGLHTHLDLSRGGELAANLEQLYGYCTTRLLEANLRNDAEAIDEVYRLVAPVAEAWRSMNGKAPPSGAGSRPTPSAPLHAAMV